MHGLYKGKLPLKLLAEGQVTSALNICVDKASQKAIEMIQVKGGSVSFTYDK